MADPAHDNMSLHEDLDLVVSALVHVQTHVLMTVPRKKKKKKKKKRKKKKKKKKKKRKKIVETEEERDVYTGSYDGCYHFHTKGALQEEWCL